MTTTRLAVALVLLALLALFSRGSSERFRKGDAGFRRGAYGSLMNRRDARKARYAEAKARGDHIGMQRYDPRIEKIVKQHGAAWFKGIEAKRAIKCPANWSASGDDMCCERWWPKTRAQRCKTPSTGKVWDRTWTAKRFNE